MSYKHALIVDDSKLARITLKKKLEQRGLEVTMAESGVEAVAKLKAEPGSFDIVFMDHLMPELDGFQATQQIKADSNIQHIPVIMCSGKESEGYLEEAQAIGASNILSKPPENEALDQVLASTTSSPAAAFSEAVEAVEAVTVTATVAPAEAVASAPAGLSEARVQELVTQAVAGQQSALQQQLQAALEDSLRSRVLQDLQQSQQRVLEDFTQGVDQRLSEQARKLDELSPAAPVMDEAVVRTLVQHQVSEQLDGLSSLSREPEPGLKALEDDVQLLRSQLASQQQNLEQTISAAVAEAMASQPGPAAAPELDVANLVSQIGDSLKPALEDWLQQRLDNQAELLKQDAKDQLELQLSYKLNEVNQQQVGVASEELESELVQLKDQLQQLQQAGSGQATLDISGELDARFATVQQQLAEQVAEQVKAPLQAWLAEQQGQSHESVKAAQPPSMEDLEQSFERRLEMAQASVGSQVGQLRGMLLVTGLIALAALASHWLL